MADTTKENPQQRASRYIDEMKDEPHSPGEVRQLLNAIKTMPLSRNEVEDIGDTAPPRIGNMPAVLQVRRGDVFIAPGVGGKKRPWAILNVRGDVVTATAMSSGNKAPNLVQTECRFWRGSWVGGATAQFPVQMVVSHITRPLTDFAALLEAEALIIKALVGEAPAIPNVIEFRSSREKTAA